MAIRFTCECGQELQAREEHAGRKTRCPACGAEMTVPQSSTEVQTAPRRDPSKAARRREGDEDDWQDSEDSGRRAATGTSRKAIWSLILGILSFGCTLFTGVPAVILGILGLRDIGRSNGRLGGNGFAITGMVTGVIGSILCLVLLFPVSVGLLLPAVQKVREAATRQQSMNSLKQIGIAFHEYHANLGSFPPPALNNKAGIPVLSWRVAILPYLGEEQLYQQFNLEEPWDGPNNIRLLKQMPKVFAHPSADSTKTAAGFCHYRGFVGPQAAFDPSAPRGTRLAEFLDGTGNTILLVEATDPVEWTKPGDLPFGSGIALPKLGIFNNGFNALLADGSVRRLPKDISDATLRAAITRNGNETLGPDW